MARRSKRRYLLDALHVYFIQRDAQNRVISAQLGKSDKGPVLIPVENAMELLDLAYANLEFEEAGDDSRKAHLAALEHLSRTSKNPELQNNVWLLGPKVKDIPALMLLRQNGDEGKGWRGLPFWWPVIVTPKSAVTSIFANDEPSVG